MRFRSIRRQSHTNFTDFQRIDIHRWTRDPGWKDLRPGKCLRDVTGILQIGDDRLDGAFGDISFIREITQPGIGGSSEQQEDPTVVGQQGPGSVGHQTIVPNIGSAGQVRRGIRASEEFLQRKGRLSDPYEEFLYIGV